MKAEAVLIDNLRDQMAALEKRLRNSGAEEWKAIIIAYRPDFKKSYIVVGDGATVEDVKKLLEKIDEVNKSA